MLTPSTLTKGYYLVRIPSIGRDVGLYPAERSSDVLGPIREVSASKTLGQTVGREAGNATFAGEVVT